MVEIPEKKRMELQVDTMTRFIALMINTSVEEYGEKILDQYEKAFYDMGTKLGNAIKPALNLTEGQNDAIALSRMVDYADTIMGYRWEYLEKNPNRAVKKSLPAPWRKRCPKGMPRSSVNDS